MSETNEDYYYYDYYGNYSDDNNSYYDDDFMYEFMEKRTRIYQAHYITVLVIAAIGLFFNVLSIAVVLWSHNLQKTRAGQYLLALEVADCLYLICLVIRHVNEPFNDNESSVHDNFLAKSSAVCQLMKVLTFAWKMSSAWITVAIATDRFISIKFPLRAIALSKRVTWIAIAAIVVASLAICMPYIAVYGLQAGSCSRFKRYDIVNWVAHRLFSIILPASLLLILTSLTIFCLWRARAERMRLSGDVQSAQTTSGGHLTVEGRLTWMLIAVSLAFLVLRVPASISYEIYSNKDQLTRDDLGNPDELNRHYSIHAAYYILDIFDTLNFGVNFFLYCICGQVFRKALNDMLTYCFCCGRRRRRERDTQYTTRHTCRTETPVTFVTTSN